MVIAQTIRSARGASLIGARIVEKKFGPVC
jgi:hypothetical protein